jgi:hypothetical protein
MSFSTCDIGYISLWSQLGESIKVNNAQNNSNIPYGGKPNSGTTKHHPVTICMGGEWYTFPSHFFLPNHARIEYVFDNFHGELPQHFNSIQGTSSTPSQLFNDQNQEEISRYVSLKSCDYLVTMLTDEISSVERMSEAFKTKDKLDIEKILYHKHNPNRFSGNYGIDKDVFEDENGGVGEEFYRIQTIDINGSKEKETVNFELLLSTNIIDPIRSSSSVARAYFIPQISPSKNSFMKYSAFKKI